MRRQTERGTGGPLLGTCTLLTALSILIVACTTIVVWNGGQPRWLLAAVFALAGLLLGTEGTVAVRSGAGLKMAAALWITGLLLWILCGFSIYTGWR